MLKLCCNILITDPANGQRVRFNYVSEIEITESVKNFTDTAKISVPRKLAYKGRNITEFIKRDHTIKIDLGYNDTLETVFRGYVTNVSTGTPLVIYCENEAYKMKRIKFPPANYINGITMSELIAEIKKLYQFKNEPVIADFNLGGLRIGQEVTVAKVFDSISSTYFGNFYFRDDVFYGTIPSTLMVSSSQINTIKFKIGYNTISDNLTYTLADDVNVQIVAKAITRNNVKLEWSEPKDAENAEVRTFYVPGATTIDQVKDFAKTKIKEFKIDKMTGEFTSFGLPLTKKGDIVHLIDEDHQERNNKKFWVDQVVRTFGQGGYRQKITLGGQLNG